MKTRASSSPLVAMAFSIVSVSLAGCSGGSDRVGPLEGPVALASSLAYLDPSTASVLVVDPAGHAGPGASAFVHRIHVDGEPTLLASIPDAADPSRRRAVVLDPSRERLVVVASERGETTDVPIGLPFDAFEVSPDGRYGLAYQPGDQAPTTSMFAFPNAVAVVALADPPTATALRLPSSGARPRDAAFAGELAILAPPAGGSPAEVVHVQLALVFVEGGIVPLDLATATAGPMVPLGSRDDVVLPAEVLFSNNGADALRGAVDDVERAYVRATNGQLYVLGITVAGDTSPLVTLENVVTPDAFVHDAELYFAPDGRELLLAAAGDELVLVDAYTGVADRFAQSTWVDTLVRFEDPDTGRALALAFATAEAHATGTLLRVDPLALDARRASGLVRVQLGDPLASAEVATGAQRAILRYAGGVSLGVLDLRASGEVLDVRMAAGPSAQALGPGGESLWVVGQSPTDDSPHLAEVTLAPALAMREVRLDETGEAVGHAGDFVWVDHGAADGAVTFFPRASLNRDHAVAVRGIAYAGLTTVPEGGSR